MGSMQDVKNQSVMNVTTGQLRASHSLRTSNLNVKASNSLFGNIYGDIKTFLELKREEVQEEKKSTAGNETPKFNVNAAHLKCPIHEEETFSFFCQ